MDEQTLADLLAALDKRWRRFPAGAVCADCGQPNRFVLCRRGRRIVCTECRLRRQGRPLLEAHHPGGRPGDLTVLVPANLHRLLTVLQDLWRGTLEPGSSAAVLLDLVLLRVLGPSFGLEV